MLDAFSNEKHLCVSLIVIGLLLALPLIYSF